MADQVPTHWQILELLKHEEPDHISGPRIASKLNISRTAVWKHIQKLRSLDYDISSHPKAGYRLLASPDSLIPEEIASRLQTAFLGKTYFHYEQTGSTNDQALRLAAQGAPHGTVVVAEEQTRGRGRLGRPWISTARKGVMFSLLLREPLRTGQAPQMGLTAALSVVKVLRDGYNLPASIKWPNDVLIRSHKVAGILTEMQSDQDLIRFLVIGIGINVNHERSDLAGPLRYPATSLALELGGRQRRQDLLLALLHQLERDHDRIIAEDFKALLPEIEDASGLLRKSITVQCGREEFSGTVLGLTPDGALRLLTTAGKEEIIWAGDVTQVEGIS